MNNSLTLVFSGEAGQGIQTIEEFLVDVIANSYHVFSCSDVMSRVRGGNNTTEIRIADSEISAYKSKIDILFLLNDHSLNRLKERIGSKTVIIGKREYVDENFLEEFKGDFRDYDFEKIAKDVGGALFLNTVVFGFTAGKLNLDNKKCKKMIEEKFSSKGKKIIDDNHKAFENGFELGKTFELDLHMDKTESLKEFYKVLNGTQAIGLGVLAGGCNFISSYPMSPSTALLSFLAENSIEFGVFVEQAEDEIAALNMVLGAWYAGARAIATTSGGGFSLMEEAMSLSGITETPCVVHLAQRPGPATGLPTRTEQGDLMQAVFAGHGDYPKIILAPGTYRDGVELGQRAFYLADKYQVPVIIMTDQFYLESFGLMGKFTLDHDYDEEFIVETSKNYKRYDLNTGPVSPRGIPGNGDGFVKVDSDEHFEDGTITEDFETRVKMHEKRLSKKDLIVEDYVREELLGETDYEILIVGWGSTRGAIKECLENGNFGNVGFLTLKQLYPLRQDLKEYFNKAKKIIAIENNSSGQLANLLKLELDVKINHKILKYSGEPFSVEEIESRLKEVLK
ncbi:2-oxoacid:acceptor oxidoreductase subunit alpha [Alkalibacter mobilis]|uniref:2-oxoacid:acceptor oxidoreductase subunit alpha n=1 Tax=Alkalibacter mobilis TaxID=2787712 RepID=UPI0018A0F68F|nr:2-oxoacid:acceptor oxidoreductase subunit alpha [Alkalibacter mobilis]MBF7096487.1 2-oxoacid:acceptor oxidoreductase subunit alpha [Alkalibacter mobilis]